MLPSLLVNWIPLNFLTSLGVSCINKKTGNCLFPWAMSLSTFARPSLEPKSMFTHRPPPLSSLRVINLALRACFESAFGQSPHGERGHRDTTACLLSKTVILKASPGYSLLEYDLFFQSSTRTLYIPVHLYHGIQPLETSLVPTRRCGK